MRRTRRTWAMAHNARLALLGAGVLLLAGCATGYSFVQPDVAGSGSYYTGDGPYSGSGYYDYYGTGPYYPGTSGYGYYNGSWPYSGAFGYYGPGYGYGSQWIFNLGVSNVWNFPGYWGPWYATGFPSWGCYSWRCGSHRHHHHGSGSWRHDDTRPPAAAPTSPRPGQDFTARRERTREITAWRHDHFVRSPRQGLTGSFAGTPALPPRIAAPAPRGTSFASMEARPVAAPARMPTPQAVSRAPRAAPPPSFRPAPPVRPVAQPSSRTSSTPGVKVQ